MVKSKKLKKAVYDTIGLYFMAIWMSFIFFLYPMIVDLFNPQDSVFYIVDAQYTLMVVIGLAGNPIGWILAFAEVRDQRLFATIGLGLIWFLAFWFTYREMKRK